MPVRREDDELAEQIIREQKQQELEAKAQEMREAQQHRMEEAKERIRARRAQAGERERTYTVQAGDSLGKIAQKLYGDGDRWTDIYEANKDQIKDPNVIQIGQELRIP